MPRRLAFPQTFSRGIIALSAWVNRAACALLLCASLAMIAVVLLQVICRYLFNNSLFWSEELARMLLVQITFLGATAAFHGRLHIAVDFLTSQVSPKLHRLLQSICLLVCAALFTAMLVYGLNFSQVLGLQQAASLPVSLAAPFLIIPISGAIMLLHCLAMLLEPLAGSGPRGPAAPPPAPPNPPPSNTPGQSS